MAPAATFPGATGPVVRAVAYIRVSRPRYGMVSPDLQLRAIREYCRLRGYLITCTLEDLDRSGRFWKRRRVEQAVALVERGEADVLVVWRMSRMTRSRLDWAVTVDRLERAGGRLESATETFDPRTSTGRLARGMLAEIAAFESDLIADGYREAWERRLSLGLPSNGQEQFGYRKLEDGRYVRDRRTGPLLAEAYRRYLDGTPVRALARWLGARQVHSPAGHAHTEDNLRMMLQRALDSGFAAGYIRHRGEFLRGTHEPLIDEDTWQAYLARRAATRRHPRPVGDEFLLAGLAWCACGAQLVCIRNLGRNDFRYRCPSHPKGGGPESIGRGRLDALTERWVIAVVADPTVRAAAQLGAEQLARSRSAEARALRRQLATAPPGARSELLGALESARADALRPAPADLARALQEDWPALDIPERRRRLRCLTDRIVVHTELPTPVLEVHTTWGSVMSYDGVAGPPPDVGPAPGAARAGDAVSSAARVDPRRLLTPTEAARIAGVSTETLRRWDLHGLMPHTQDSPDGRGRRYDLRDVRARRPRERPTGGRPLPSQAPGARPFR